MKSIQITLEDLTAEIKNLERRVAKLEEEYRNQKRFNSDIGEIVGYEVNQQILWLEDSLKVYIDNYFKNENQ